MADHDHSYKQLFSNPELVRDLLQGFVLEDWVNELDIATQERENNSYLSDDLREQEDDIIWRVDCSPVRGCCTRICKKGLRPPVYPI